jgi:hypothetical protein
MPEQVERDPDTVLGDDPQVDDNGFIVRETESTRTT